MKMSIWIIKLHYKQDQDNKLKIMAFTRIASFLCYLVSLTSKRGLVVNSDDDKFGVYCRYEKTQILQIIYGNVLLLVQSLNIQIFSIYTLFISKSQRSQSVHVLCRRCDYTLFA